MISRRTDYPSWRDVPARRVFQLLNLLKAGHVYYPQHFRGDIACLAFATCSSDEVLVSAIEGLELAMTIADQLSLSYSVYLDDQATLRGIREAAARGLRTHAMHEAELPSQNRLDS